ncbi:DUF1707 domain-containing protein [Modestobacter sp. Leaf380]|uniref:DUF1707 SHOCT-like domain-containing protein n=1 Tax=Modestobacter sp. Leaf380 TaxID=1736356 RepID=UPI0006F76BA7|nr:DUF1707 domain-containing protein [Modestobacter sp. Leaf380]KQS63992.1 hypothetical protein ASG41_17880 [Modestobacter sp. Leaf380]
MDGSRGVRISDADRERAAQRLQTAMAEGRITMLELDERLGVVYAARYADELVPPLADLPPVPGPPGVVGPPVPASAWHPPVVAHPGVPVSADAPVVLRSGVGDIKRKGRWAVPPRLRVHSTMGTVVLDFCDTEVPHAVVDIEVQLGAGSARILVPDGASADVDGVNAGMGSVTCKVSSLPQPGMPHFRVHGKAGMGSVTVRNRYRFGGHRF